MLFRSGGRGGRLGGPRLGRPPGLLGRGGGLLDVLLADAPAHAGAADGRDIEIIRRGNDVTFSLKDGTGSVLVQNWYANDHCKLDEVEFADGTKWSVEDVASRAVAYGTDEGEVLGKVENYGGHDTIRAGGGNDEVYAGYGDDKVYGEAGDDRLYGDVGDDTLVGGAGDDYLEGGYGSDTYAVDRKSVV